MRRLLPKITLLILALVLTLAFVTSCSIFSPIRPTTECEHEYTTVLTSPTCDTEGESHRVCLLCGDSTKVGSTPATGHDFEPWVITLHPTATTEGERERVCSRCGVKETDTVLAHEHSMTLKEAVPVTCDTDGWDEYRQCRLCDYNTKIIIKATGHEWSGYVSLGNGTHKCACLNDSTHIDVAICTYEEGEDECSVCGAEYCFGVRYGNSSYGYYAFEGYSDASGMQSLYRDLTTASELFFESDKDVASDDGYYVIGGFNIDDYGITLEAAKAVWKIFYVSSPAYYWLDASVIASGSTVYLTISDVYADREYRSYCDGEIERMDREVKALISDEMSELERAVAIASYIVKGLEYAYEQDGVTPVSDMWAHSMTGLAVHGYGVCEAYSKSFMYLCLRNGVDCIAGSGYAGGEAHAWNYFKVGDVWYGADLTWTDHSGEEVFFDKFGLSSTSIFKDHTPHSSTEPGVNFIYEAPTLSSADLQLASLYKGGEYVGTYASLDEALDAIADSEAEYEVYIGFYLAYENGITHALYRSEMPRAKNITIRGRSQYVGEGYLDNNSIIELTGSLTLGSDLTFADVHITVEDGISLPTIQLKTYDLNLTGDSVYVEAYIKGGEERARNTVTAATERGAYLIGGANVYRVRIETDKVVFGADSTVTYCTSTGIYTTNGVTVNIRYYEPRY